MPLITKVIREKRPWILKEVGRGDPGGVGGMRESKEGSDYNLIFKIEKEKATVAWAPINLSVW